HCRRRASSPPRPLPVETSRGRMQQGQRDSRLDRRIVRRDTQHHARTARRCKKLLLVLSPLRARILSKSVRDRLGCTLCIAPRARPVYTHRCLWIARNRVERRQTLNSRKVYNSFCPLLSDGCPRSRACSG
ncbi:hypothetical protein PFISCL1PPCAC_5179, partial [Pristionchus fissidentatus]